MRLFQIAVISAFVSVASFACAQTPTQAQVTLASAQAATAAAQSMLTTAQSTATLPQVTATTQATLLAAQATLTSALATQAALAAQSPAPSATVTSAATALVDAARNSVTAAQSAVQVAQTASATTTTIVPAQLSLVAAQAALTSAQALAAIAVAPATTAAGTNATTTTNTPATDLALVAIVDSLFDLARTKTNTSGLGPTFDMRLRAIDMIGTIGTRSENTAARLASLLPVAGKAVNGLTLEDNEKYEFARHVILAFGKLGPAAKDYVPQIMKTIAIDSQLLPVTQDTLNALLAVKK